MKNLYLIYICLFLFTSLYAEEKLNERVYVHTDKQCYVAGEEIWMKFYTVNPNFQPSTLSKVGYVEISDTERPYVQLKLALENGSGNGRIKIPVNTPSGTYQLYGYTRFMRNEGENVFFRKEIAILNIGQRPDPTRVEIVEDIKENKQKAVSPTITVRTDKREYFNRDLVNLSLENLPENIADLVISVSRNDSIISVPQTHLGDWVKGVSVTSALPVSNQWLPEYEGHIIEGNVIPKSSDNQFLSNIAFVGNDIRYINGQKRENDKGSSFSFYTKGIYGEQQIVASITSDIYGKVPYRLDISSPFCEILPNNLAPLQINPKEKYLMERYLGTQLLEGISSDTIESLISLKSYYNLPTPLTYDLDEYTRFSTLSETIFEYVRRVRVNRVDGKQKIKVYIEEEERYNTGNTLVLLDGVPIYDHEDLLSYNPQLIKRINIYTGRYVFGGETFECIVSFLTHQANLPFFQLGEQSQLFEYTCPELPTKFEFPDYSIEDVKKSRKPDFRHTLYWNPSGKTEINSSTPMSFYTSDLCGDFEIIVKGITVDGKMIYGYSHFHVKEIK